MRLTEAQIRRTVRGILREAHVLPALPKPDPGLGKVIDIIGLKVKRAADSDPEFIAIQDELKQIDPDDYSQRSLTRKKAMDLIPDAYSEEIEKISRVMLAQAKKLVPTIVDDMREITVGMSPEEIQSAFSQFEDDIASSALENIRGTNSYTAGFERLNNAQFAVVEELLTYIFPLAPPVSRFSELTDPRIYNTILHIYGYYPPEKRRQRERQMDEDDADPNQQFNLD
jgi:hypothetical protein